MHTIADFLLQSNFPEGCSGIGHVDSALTSESQWAGANPDDLEEALLGALERSLDESTQLSAPQTPAWRAITPYKSVIGWMFWLRKDQIVYHTIWKMVVAVRDSLAPQKRGQAT